MRRNEGNIILAIKLDCVILEEIYENSFKKHFFVCFLIKLWLIYNVVPVSAVQQCDTVIHKSTLFMNTIFHFFVVVVVFFPFSRAAPEAHGGSQLGV